MSKTFTDLMREARAAIREVTPREAELRAERGTSLVDVREDDRVGGGAHPRRAHVAKSYVEQQIEAPCPTATPRSSSTAPAASARCSRPRRSRPWATRSISMSRRLPAVEVGRPAVDPAGPPLESRSSATAATC